MGRMLAQKGERARVVTTGPRMRQTNDLPISAAKDAFSNTTEARRGPREGEIGVMVTPASNFVKT